jgi:hypothetical protein
MDTSWHKAGLSKRIVCLMRTPAQMQLKEPTDLPGQLHFLFVHAGMRWETCMHGDSWHFHL